MYKTFYLYITVDPVVKMIKYDETVYFSCKIVFA